MHLVNPGNKGLKHPEGIGHLGIWRPKEGCMGSGRMVEEVVTGGVKGNEGQHAQEVGRVPAWLEGKFKPIQPPRVIDKE